MTTQNSLFRRFGRLELPLAESEEADLASLDPARDILLDLFAAALNDELAPVWESATAGIAALEGHDPVQFKVPGRLDEEALQQFKTEWPILAVARSTKPAKVAPWSLEQQKVTREWDIDYILGPLTFGSSLRLTDVLERVANILILVVNAGGHRAYRTQVNQGFTFAENVIGDDGAGTCGFYDCKVTEFATGPAEFSKGGPKYHAASITLETVEVSNYAAGDEDGESVPLAGATLQAGVTQSGDPVIIVRS